MEIVGREMKTIEKEPNGNSRTEEWNMRNENLSDRLDSRLEWAEGKRVNLKKKNQQILSNPKNRKKKKFLEE